MDQIFTRLAAVARSEGGEEQLRKMLDSFFPISPPSVSTDLPSTSDTSSHQLSPGAVDVTPVVLSASSPLDQPPIPSAGRSRKDHHLDQLSASAGVGTGCLEAPPAKRSKKPRKPYSPDVQGRKSKHTAHTGSSRSAKGGSGRGHVTVRGHLASDPRPACAPGSVPAGTARNLLPQQLSMDCLRPSAPATCSPLLSSCIADPSLPSTSAVTPPGAPIFNPPPISSPPVQHSSAANAAEPRALDAGSSFHLLLQQLQGLSSGDPPRAACLSGAPTATYSPDPGSFQGPAATPAAGNQDGRQPASAANAVAGDGDSSSSDGEADAPVQTTRHGSWDVTEAVISGQKFDS
ncbi:uncharacterized protein [Hyperolius riggenbachi]|uniref:uncharacterized protein isoform X2 n=1 Tax=Hyperolius riggenbachi TaxID=752182 RepID=UPI0035A2C474